ncbi:MAG: Maleate cis-trans isomerase [Chloroflexi bacterium]|nr:MAG: Maleate cis-trans isomerase [Chloroflexota bacterium]
MGIYGPLGTIGLISPPRTNETAMYEAMQVVPEGVSWCLSVLGMADHSAEEYKKALAMVETCVKELVERKASAIAFGGIPVITSQGPEYYLQLAEDMSRYAGGAVPVTTDIAAVMAALRELGMQRITIISNYQDAILRRAIGAFETAGFEVVASKGLHLSLAQQLSEGTFDQPFEMAMEAFNEHPDTDGIFFSCPQWPVVRNIDRIEQATGKPVVTQFQAISWWAMNQLGIQRPVPGFGRLLAQPEAAGKR